VLYFEAAHAVLSVHMIAELTAWQPVTCEPDGPVYSLPASHITFLRKDTLRPAEPVWRCDRLRPGDRLLVEIVAF
jgi:hypothetical protein